MKRAVRPANLLLLFALLASTTAFLRVFLPGLFAEATPEPFELSPEAWREVIATPRRIGAAEARIRLVIFSDYGCSFCAAIQPALGYLREKYPKDLAIIYRHYVASGESGFRQAIVADCALVQDRFAAVHPHLFGAAEAADLVHLERLDSYMPEPRLFTECVKEEQPRAEIERDIALARRLGVSGTPTVLLEGREVHLLHSIDPVERELRSAIGSVR